MKLISMTDFVLERENMIKQTEQEMSNDLYVLSQYAHFLKQSLTLGMFIPCDEAGDVLEEPNKQDYIFEHHPELTGNPKEYDEDKYRDDCLEWILAKEKVLFEGFVYNTADDWLERVETDGGIWAIDPDYLVKHTVEDLIPCDITLTKSAIKQIGL